MKKHLLRAAVAAFVSVAGGAAAQQAQQDFTLLNMTGATIAHLYVSPSRHALWGQDVLGIDVLPHGQSTQIMFSPRNNVCVYDFMVTYGDGMDVQWGGLDLCAISIVGLFYNPNTGETWAETR